MTLQTALDVIRGVSDDGRCETRIEAIWTVLDKIGWDKDMSDIWEVCEKEENTWSGKYLFSLLE